MKLLVVLLLVVGTYGKVFERCEWIQVLKDEGMDDYHGISLANWVCLTKWESDFNTTKEKHFDDGSTNYGIFQFNSRLICTDGETPSDNACDIDCNDLLSDNVDVAINCAKSVAKKSAGIRSWGVWREHCENQDVSSYVEGC